MPTPQSIEFSLAACNTVAILAIGPFQKDKQKDN
jgi:hypothetical protein